jgi:CRP-like cAMP-binding protein
MSPRAKNFNAGSIIFFEGDVADSVYLLKEGKVNLEYTDVTTREKIIDLISTGEFFGVKSGLIKYPREETAKVMDTSVLYEFSATEFESLIIKNHKIILKMLKVFSNHLRNIGKQIQNLVSEKTTSDAADEFFQIGDYYYKSKKYKSAITVYQRYINYYPSGRFAKLSKERLGEAKNALNMYGDEGGPAPILNNGGVEKPVSPQAARQAKQEEADLSGGFSADSGSGDDFGAASDFDDTSDTSGGGGFTDFDSGNDTDFENSSEESSTDLNSFDSPAASSVPSNSGSTDEQKIYYKGVSFMNTGKYLDAFNTLKKVLAMNDENTKILASFEIGKCFFFLEKYSECINHLTKFLSLHPTFDERNEVLFYVGNSYAKTGEKDKADKIYKGILSKTKPNDPVNRKTQRALKELG